MRKSHFTLVHADNRDDQGTGDRDADNYGVPQVYRPSGICSCYKDINRNEYDDGREHPAAESEPEDSAGYQDNPGQEALAEGSWSLDPSPSEIEVSIGDAPKGREISRPAVDQLERSTGNKYRYQAC